MKNPWFPLYVADYLAKTSHLSQAQHGAYFLLMLHYYATGEPIPANAMQVHTICRCTTDAERHAANTVLQMFFTREEAFYRHLRIDQELATRSDLRAKRQNAAQVRWGEAAMQVHMHVHTQSQSHSQSQEVEKAVVVPNSSANGKEKKRFFAFEAETPKDQPPSSLARGLAEKLQLQINLGLLTDIESAIRCAAERKATDFAGATDYLFEMATKARENSKSINRFWFQHQDDWEAKPPKHKKREPPPPDGVALKRAQLQAARERGEIE